MKKKRIIAAALLGAILIIILLSAFVTVLEATHDCSGTDCEVCRLAQLIYSVIRGFSFAAVMISLYIAAHSAEARGAAYHTAVRFMTPVTNKVRLLN